MKFFFFFFSLYGLGHLACSNSELLSENMNRWATGRTSRTRDQPIARPKKTLLKYEQ
jgi:hypothetical protein